MTNPAKILVVEDNDDVRLMMAKLLKRFGYTVVEASCVAEGIAKLDGQAIALLDFFLPDGTGADVLAHIRQQNHPTRIAFTTAAFDIDIPREKLFPGDAIFTKPIDLNKLLQWIMTDPVSQHTD